MLLTSSQLGFLCSGYVITFFCVLSLLVFSDFIRLSFQGKNIVVCIRGEDGSYVLQSFEIGQVDILTCCVQ